jgi:hypothetical protein
MIRGTKKKERKKEIFTTKKDQGRVWEPFNPIQEFREVSTIRFYITKTILI